MQNESEKTKNKKRLTQWNMNVNEWHTCWIPITLRILGLRGGWIKRIFFSWNIPTSSEIKKHNIYSSLHTETCESSPINTKKKREQIRSVRTDEEKVDLSIMCWFWKFLTSNFFNEFLLKGQVLCYFKVHTVSKSIFENKANDETILRSTKWTVNPVELKGKLYKLNLQRIASCYGNTSTD